MIRVALIIAAMTAPASAQTMQDAARINLGIAAQLCLQNGVQPQQRAANFRAAGFAETVTRDPQNTDTTHIFTAPSDTAQVELYYGETPDYCAASSTLMSVNDASALLDQIMPTLRPGYTRKITQTGTAHCVRYEDPTNPIGEVIGVLSTTDTCTNDGTSRIFSSFRV